MSHISDLRINDFWLDVLFLVMIVKYHNFALWSFCAVMELFNIYDYLHIIFCGSQVPSAIKEKVINAWLEARPRNIIADETEISMVVSRI